MNVKEFLDQLYSLTDDSKSLIADSEETNSISLETFINNYNDLKQKINKIEEYCSEKIKKSFYYDFGLDQSNLSDSLFTETVIELQHIISILHDKDETQMINNTNKFIDEINEKDRK